MIETYNKLLFSKKTLMCLSRALALSGLAVVGWMPLNANAFEQEGNACWYGPRLHGRTTASGEVFDQNKLTAAHKSLPFGAKARVTNLENKKTVRVKINDRGPHVGDCSIDVSRAAAKRLGMTERGITRVRIEAAGP